jgi:hypothetical protein
MLLRDGGYAKDERYGVKQGALKGKSNGHTRRDLRPLRFQFSLHTWIGEYTKMGSKIQRSVLYSAMAYSDCIELASWSSTDHL